MNFYHILLCKTFENGDLPIIFSTVKYCQHIFQNTISDYCGLNIEFYVEKLLLCLKTLANFATGLQHPIQIFIKFLRYLLILDNQFSSHQK